jgi:hypothetical protein
MGTAGIISRPPKLGGSFTVLHSHLNGSRFADSSEKLKQVFPSEPDLQSIWRIDRAA